MTRSLDRGLPQRLFTLLPIAIFILALTQPAFTTEKNTYFGIEAIGLGAVGIIADPLGCLAWFANPLFVVAIILLLVKKKRAISWSIYLSAAALLLAGSFIPSHHRIPINEGGAEETISARQGGYWLWLISMLTLLVVTLIASRKSPTA